MGAGLQSRGGRCVRSGGDWLAAAQSNRVTEPAGIDQPHLPVLKRAWTASLIGVSISQAVFAVAH